MEVLEDKRIRRTKKLLRQALKKARKQLRGYRDGFGLAKRETGRARCKKKKCFGGSVCASAGLLPPAGDG